MNTNNDSDKENEKVIKRALVLISAIRKNNVVNSYNVGLETKYLLENADEEIKLLLLKEVYLWSLTNYFYNGSPMKDDNLLRDLKFKDGNNVIATVIQARVNAGEKNSIAYSLSKKVCQDIVSVLIENNKDDNQKKHYLDGVPWVDLSQYKTILEKHFPLKYGAVLDNLSCFAQAEKMLKTTQLIDIEKCKLDANDFIEDILEKAFTKEGKASLIIQMRKEADNPKDRCDNERSVVLAIKTRLKRCKSVEELTEYLSIYKDFLKCYEKENPKNKHKAIYYVLNANKNISKRNNGPLGLSAMEINKALENVLNDAIHEKDIMDNLLIMKTSPEGMFKGNIREVSYYINSLSHANLDFVSERDIKISKDGELNNLQKTVREIKKSRMEKDLQEEITDREKSGINEMPIYTLKDYNSVYIENWETSIFDICSRIMKDVKDSCELVEKIRVSQEGEYTVIRVSHVSNPGVFDEMRMKEILSTIALERVSALSDWQVTGVQKETNERELVELNKRSDIYLDEYLSQVELDRYRNSQKALENNDTRLLKKTIVKKF